jgi:hypothetical protein
MITIKEHENKHFSFKLEVNGADLKNTSARLIFEGKTKNHLFPVNINNTGLCEYQVMFNDINTLKEGKVYLEVLANDTYFKPWEDTYRIETTPKPIIRLEENNIKSTSSVKPNFDILRREYRSLLREHGVSFLNGDTKENLEIKHIVISLLENKYGSLIKTDLPQLVSIKIDELIIL